MAGVINLLNYLYMYGPKNTDKEPELEPEPEIRLPDLPRDLQREILSLDFDTLKKAVGLSKETDKIIGPILAEKYCQRPITGQEMLKYLQTQPEMFALINTNVYNFKSNALAPKQTDTTLASLYTKTGHSYEVKQYKIDPTDMEFTDMPYLRTNYKAAILYEFEIADSIPGLDVKSLYKIYRKRLGCVKLNPAYGKDYVHNLFDDLVEKYKYSDMILYVYLLMNLRILNITIPRSLHLKNGEIYDISGILYQLTPDIPLMIELIHRAIDNF